MLADEIDDRPASFALGDRTKLQPRQLPPPQPAPHQQPQQDPIPQPFCRFRIRDGKELLGLLQRQPVAGPHAGAPGTPRIPAAVSGESPPWAAASDANLRRAASERLIEAADSPRSMRCER